MSKKFLVTLSNELGETAEILKKRNRYRTLSEYVNGLIRYDAMVQRPHRLSKEHATMTLSERDMLDADLLKQVKTGKGLRGSMFEARVEEAVRKLTEETGMIPTKDEVAEWLAKQGNGSLP